MQNILSGFLSANLLPIGSDDDKLALLEKAAEELSKEIVADPALAYRFALVGFDEGVAAMDPVHKKASDVIALKWQTMTNRTGGSPVQVHRAVLLRALEIAAESSRDLRHAMILVTDNMRPGSLDGRAKDSIAAMLSRWESAITAELGDAWVNTVDMSLPKLSGKVKKAPLSKDDLVAGFGRAAGPQDREGKPYPTANPHWPNANNNWAFEFAPRAADAVLSAIHAGAKSYTEDLQDALRETVANWSISLERMAMRDAKSELLWIRESKYSPSARVGYKTLNPTDVALHAILDVSRTVTKLAPPSVEYFLRELVGQLTQKRVRLADVLTAIGPKIALMPEGKAVVAEKLPPQGRRSWLDCAIRGLAGGAFEDQTGMPSEYEDELAEIAVRLYRELQIRKLLVAPL